MNGLAQDAPRAGELGEGQVVNCAGNPFFAYGAVTLSVMSGVDAEIAVAVVGDEDNTDLNGIYVAEGHSPDELRDRLTPG